jgi:hypothetical protein
MGFSVEKNPDSLLGDGEVGIWDNVSRVRSDREGRGLRVVLPVGEPPAVSAAIVAAASMAPGGVVGLSSTFSSTRAVEKDLGGGLAKIPAGTSLRGDKDTFLLKIIEAGRAGAITLFLARCVDAAEPPFLEAASGASASRLLPERALLG